MKKAVSINARTAGARQNFIERESIMEMVNMRTTMNFVGGKDDAGCGLYLLEAGLAAVVGGMAFGPVGFGLVTGFLLTVSNPCK
jgi:hypothetical protein